MRLPFPLLLAVLLAGTAMSSLLAEPARAEGQTPGFNLPQIITPDEVGGLSVDFDDAFNTIPNDYLSDSMKLNYQISLLEKMVERQSALGKVGDSFSKLGIAFEEPAPPRGICQQLPVNAPCLKAYPDLYSALVSSRKAYYKELEAQSAAVNGPAPGVSAEESAEDKARREKEEAARKEREAKKERQSRYTWTNVTCVIGQCHGVIIGANDKNKGFRATVHKGARLPDDTLVQDVSADGIRVSIDGDSIALRPAPGEEPTVAAAGSEGNAAAVMADQLSNAPDVMTPNGIQKANTQTGDVPPASIMNVNAAAPQPATQVSSDAVAPAGQTSAEPALGPSGLF